MYEEKEITITKPNLDSVFDKFEKEDKCIEWVKDMEGNVLAERLVPSVSAEVELKGVKNANI